MKWARERLLSQHKTNNEYNYLLLQKSDDLLSFDIIIYVENIQPVQPNLLPVIHFIANRLLSGKYQVISDTCDDNFRLIQLGVYLLKDGLCDCFLLC